MVSEGRRGGAWEARRSWERRRTRGVRITWLSKIGAAVIETRGWDWVEDGCSTSYRPVESRLEGGFGKQEVLFAAAAVNSTVTDSQPVEMRRDTEDP